MFTVDSTLTHIHRAQYSIRHIQHNITSDTYKPLCTLNPSHKPTLSHTHSCIARADAPTHYYTHCITQLYAITQHHPYTPIHTQLSTYIYRYTHLVISYPHADTCGTHTSTKTHANAHHDAYISKCIHLHSHTYTITHTRVRKHTQTCIITYSHTHTHIHHHIHTTTYEYTNVHHHILPHARTQTPSHTH